VNETQRIDQYFEETNWTLRAMDLIRGLKRDVHMPEIGIFDLDLFREHGLCENHNDFVVITNRMLGDFQFRMELKLNAPPALHHWHLRENAAVKNAILQSADRTHIDLNRVSQATGVDRRELSGVIRRMMVFGVLHDEKYIDDDTFSFTSANWGDVRVAGGSNEYPFTALAGLYSPGQIELGAGAWGAVIEHTLQANTVWGKVGDKVALKFVPASQLTGMLGTNDREIIQKRLLREFEIGRRHNSRRLVRTHDVFKTSIRGLSSIVRQYYVVAMEHIKGDVLSSSLLRGMTADQRFKVALGLSKALLDMAGIGVVHRDVKPGNAMLRNETSDEVVLLDYGIAVGESDGTLTDSAANFSPLYASIQQLDNPRDEDPADDVFSLGLSIAEILMAEKPYRNVRRHDIAEKKRNGYFQDEALDAVEKEAASLVADMTMPSRASRPTIGRVVERLSAMRT